MEYNSEQLNYFRICYIAFNLVPEGLRQVFKQEWDFLFKTAAGEWKDTPKNGSDFCNHESRKSRAKNARYLATIQNGNTAKWDCSCLFFAILFSDSIGTTLSAAIKKEVDDLRQVRNDLAHISEAKLTDTEFRGHVGRVLLAFNSLSLPIGEIETVKNQTSFPTAEVKKLMAQVVNLQSELKEVKFDLRVAQDTIQEKEEQVECLTQEIHSKVESFCNLTFKPSHQIIRRSNDVTRIMAKMQDLDNDSKGAVSTIYLSGNPGCGKTQLARQIGEEFFSRGSSETEGLRFVATLNAETLETLADSYLSQAKHLGITEYALVKLATAEVNPKERIQQLRCLIFPQLKQFSQWLIIADNIVNLSLVYEYLPQTASEEWGRGQVLITTQDSSAIPTNAPHTYHESLSQGMQPKDAVELLIQVSEMPNNEEAQTVAEALDYQPLSLAAGASYVQFVSRFSTYDWSNFLRTLADVEREVTEERLTLVNPAYPKKMTEVIQLAIDTTLKSDEVLRQLFLFLSLCDSEPVPIQAAVSFVKTRTSGETEEMIKAKILNSSLIIHLYSEDKAPRYFRVHSVVHEVLRKMPLMEITEKHECLSVTVKVFFSLIEPEQDRLLESGDVCVMLRRITTHCKALYEILTSTFPAEVVWVTELAPFISPDTVISWLCSTAAVFYNISNLTNAILFSTSACNFVQYISNTREGDLIKANVFDVHGLTLSMTCQYKSSILYHEKATKIYTESYNWRVAGSYNNLGNAYENLGQYNQAKEYHEKALMITKKTFGEEHANVASSFNNLGNDYHCLEQYNEAKEYHEKALVISKKIFGDHHANVASSYMNLGTDYRSLGQCKEAKEYHEKALIINKKIFGEEHANVATTYMNLGNDYQHLGQYNKAKEYHEKALVIDKKIFGEEHAIVASSYNKLGDDYQHFGQYSDAKEYHEKALILQKKIFGKDADVASSYNKLGTDHWNLGQYNEAKKYHEKALMVNKKIFGEEHADVASSYDNLGNDYQLLGQYNKAREYHEKAMVIIKKSFGEEHPNVASCYNNLGNCYHHLGKYNEAKEYHEKAMAIIKKSFGEEHPNVASSYNNLGNDYHHLGQYIEATEYHKKGLIIEKKIFGKEHPNVASSYNNLGNDYLHLGQYNEAAEYHQKGLTISKKIFGEVHPNVASSYNNLGNDYRHLGRYNEAKEYHERALIINKKIFGEEHTNVALSYDNLGNDYRHLGQYSEAKEYHEKAQIINKNIYSKEHANVVSSYNKVDWIDYQHHWTVQWRSRMQRENTGHHEKDFWRGKCLCHIKL